MKRKLIFIFSLLAACSAAIAQNNIAEEVAWVVGDQPIWKSEIEEAYRNMIYERTPIKGDPYCVIPENLAVDKLFLHQADIDTVEIQESMAMAEVEARLNYFTAQLGSKEKMEEYFHKSTPELRESLLEMVRNSERIRTVQRDLTKNVKTTPSDIRRYYDRLPADSIPYVPMQVEVQIISVNPPVPREEVEEVKARLRDFADRVSRGESEFSTLAILYSEDTESAKRGGETGFLGKAHLDPEYAAVAFNLNDPKKVSKIVESQYGYHIIQLIEKRGDRINTRHIMLRPHISDNDLERALVQLDSLRTQIVDRHEVTFEEAVPWISQDKDTRLNSGRMVNSETGTTRFEMADLPQEIAREVDNLQIGEVSKPFIMRDPKTNREVVVLAKLTNRIEGHKANLSDDFQQIKAMCENAMREKIIKDWVAKKISETYVRIEPGWRGCDFVHSGWIKEK
ncbi:MAG: peptidylprolyl isomerase [Clostridium sp.]|nr:peptidylprolyl isomerase [Clostridium sp.]